jgi:hypothetical protein
MWTFTVTSSPPEIRGDAGGAYLVGTEDWGLVCGGVRRALVITLPPPVADLPNERKIKNGGIY